MSVEEYGRYLDHYMILGFIDKEGTLYTDKSEVERLKRRYGQTSWDGTYSILF